MIVATAITAYLYKRQSKAAEAGSAAAQAAMAEVADECFSNIR